MPRRPTNPLSEHVQRLQDEHDRLVREMAEMEKNLRRKPKAPKPKPVQEVKLRAANVAAIDLPRPKDHRYLGGATPMRHARSRRRAKPDVRMAQVKFWLLCLVLAAVLVFVWKNLPA
ncbi:MAG: hypothetical protein FGM15_01925 [Chthoniobacterales bacterium]|nr:hypothetical protein [Chthoniobacterales bacterium]